jgi:hypothetical protein
MSGTWDKIGRAAKLAHAKPVSKAKRCKQRNRIFPEVAERLAKGLPIPAAAIEYVTRAPIKNAQPPMNKDVDDIPDNRTEADLMRAHMRDL